MTPEQRERARRLIETVAEHAESDARYYAGPNGSDLDAPGNRRMAEKYVADATAEAARDAIDDAIDEIDRAHVVALLPVRKGGE